jgi:hypothetical protein
MERIGREPSKGSVVAWVAAPEVFGSGTGLCSLGWQEQNGRARRRDWGPTLAY